MSIKVSANDSVCSDKLDNPLRMHYISHTHDMTDDNAADNPTVSVQYPKDVLLDEVLLVNQQKPLAENKSVFYIRG